MTTITFHPSLNFICQCASEATPFCAEWPDRLNPDMDNCLVKTAKVFWEVISYIVFPIILIRCLLSSIRNSLFKVLILPGAKHVEKDILESDGKKLLEDCHGERLSLYAPDGAKLDAVFFKGATHPEKVIFYAFGNGGQWEIAQTKVEKLQQLFGVSILMINPRGVGESDGKRTPEGYALDTYTGYEYLVNEKFDLNNVLFLGHSMGAAYGSCGAALIQEKYPEKQISFIHDRSYSNLTITSQEIVDDVSCCCSIPLTPFVPCLFKMFSMELDSQKAFESLKGRKCVIYSKNDDIITYQASLDKALIDADYKDFDRIELDSLGCDHNRQFNDREENAFIVQVENMLGLEKKSQLRLKALRDFENGPIKKAV